MRASEEEEDDDDVERGRAKSCSRGMQQQERVSARQRKQIFSLFLARHATPSPLYQLKELLRGLHVVPRAGVLPHAGVHHPFQNVLLRGRRLQIFDQLEGFRHAVVAVLFTFLNWVRACGCSFGKTMKERN